MGGDASEWRVVAGPDRKNGTSLVLDIGRRHGLSAGGRSCCLSTGFRLPRGHVVSRDGKTSGEQEGKERRVGQIMTTWVAVIKCTVVI